MAKKTKTTDEIILDVKKLNPAQKTSFANQAKTLAAKPQDIKLPGQAGTFSRLDTSKLTAAQKQALTAKLKTIARGVAPFGSIGSLIGAEGGHSSHNDTDGWF